ncbi:AMP-binding enzyme [Gemmatimonas sp.]|uniref:AMP-binding enzyme n=1 Tax=Gemmatimonas sp. TaxID=1962908 RepID=UPI0035618836
MLGYHLEPDRTATCYIEIDDERWFQTSDNVEIDAEGDVFYLGRSDDIINSSGYRIGPQEVENALISHPDVLECAVVGQPDPKRGEVVVAFVVLVPGTEASGATAEALQQYVKKVTAPYKYPRRVEFVDELPKTVNGKLRRNELRKAVLDG